MKKQTAAPGLESFWETCDQDSISEHPLMRELCYRLDSIQRVRSMIADAEYMGDDEVVAVLSRQFDEQHALVRRLRDEIGRIGAVPQAKAEATLP
jgi:hypothetical protein